VSGGESPAASVFDRDVIRDCAPSVGPIPENRPRGFRSTPAKVALHRGSSPCSTRCHTEQGSMPGRDMEA
jgi:hypothetical protein